MSGCRQSRAAGQQSTHLSRGIDDERTGIAWRREGPHPLAVAEDSSLLRRMRAVVEVVTGVGDLVGDAHGHAGRPASLEH